MFYVPSSVDINTYRYLVDYGDNFIVLSSRSSSGGSSGDADIINCIICYLEPSFSTLPYTYYSYEPRSFDKVNSYLTHDFYYSRDFPISCLLALCLTFLLCIILNGFTRIVQKGGVLFPH